MAKGNRTRGPDRITKGTTGFIEVSQRFKNETDTYKKYAAARRANRKYTQQMTGDLYDRIKEYATDCDNAREPMTMAGMMIATNTNKDFWSKGRQGDYDYLLDEYIELHNITESDITYIDGLPYHIGDEGPVLLLMWSDVLEKCSMLLQDQLERNCYTNKGNPAGSIFSLKAQFKWREEDPTTTYSSNTLIIADKEQAVKALEMLNPSNSNGSGGSGNNW